jgi:hypothetical protein
MTEISKRLDVEGPDRDGEYELTLSDLGCDSGRHSHWITREEADRLIEALKPAPDDEADDPDRLDEEDGKL